MADVETHHRVFTPPDDENVRICRYLDFTKFVAMLETGSLFFCRSDRLGDPFEGAYPKRALARIRDHFGADGEREVRFRARFREWVRISCWHINEVESAAMWKLFTSTSDALAVVSTYARLKEAIDAAGKRDGRRVLIGSVAYVDYDRDDIAIDDPFWPYLHKRRPFEHERELRAVEASWPEDLPADPDAPAAPPPGIAIPVDLDVLVESIRLSPTCSSWFKDLVRAVGARYGLRRPIEDSTLDATPLFDV